MILRTYAIVKQNRRVLYFLSAICALGTIAQLAIAVIFVPRLFYHYNPLPELVGPNHVVGLGCLKVRHPDAPSRPNRAHDHVGLRWTLR